ncbi:VCBS repeat-containing protein [Croceivirga sp. JEA036]|uniref:VCBS repeat-containing protein n=1 Tax=Croceivirga sp. JEA036 TaxID=2721162 RepID=UPI001438C982|nr:VCBS repeat-containing protein [Croceivirga sp. JEA036]NJB36475.1 VCBS repeat-containing protein [Croceivirga sp. JEA036]
MKSIVWIALVYVASCSSERDTKGNDEKRFTLLSSSVTGIDFKNEITSTNQFNFLNYPYIYNGGGVAIGDINNDGLEDVYLSANQNSNALYLNQGNFKFKEVTKKAGLEDSTGWTTGISMVDINADGYLDIYVCKSGKIDVPSQRANKLYINNGDLTFTEAAKEYGLADTGFGTQAYFLDYDLDQDIDVYIVNHRPDFGNLKSTATIIQEASDQLYRNDNGQFINVSKTSGIQNKAWGLSAAIADFNEDGWPDVYVCNDFSEPDFLYINNQKGGFTDQILKTMDHISFNSMGSDVADFDNDGMLDIMVLDMSAEDHVRSKTNMPSMSTEAFENAVAKGYHYQYMFNMLQWNRGGATFSEIGHMAHVAKTDWSWAPLFADLDNDGLKDLLVTNGIKKDVGNVDFRNTLNFKVKNKEPMSLNSVLDMVPASKIPNYVFHNQGDLTFSKVQEDWGFGTPSFSNGAAYADLDNDGDLDIVVNNLDDSAFVYRNNTEGNFLQMQITGPKNNPLGLGVKVVVTTNKGQQIQQMYANRGFQSSVSTKLHFGLGDASIENVIVYWPDRKKQELGKVKANQVLKIAYAEARSSKESQKQEHYHLKKVDLTTNGLDYQHQEQPFNDYAKQLLLPYKMSQSGPYMAVADVNADGLEDLYVGGAQGQEASLYIQLTDGSFKKQIQQAFIKDAMFEDLESLFFDYDKDGDLDLYVVSGGNEKKANAGYYQDRLYNNDGVGNFSKTIGILPKISIAGQVVKTADIDNDGDLDLFVGGRHVPWAYPSAPQSMILRNDNGKFTDVSNTVLRFEHPLGMVTDAIFTDIDGDNDEDLLVVGEWMPITILQNDNGIFKSQDSVGLEESTGLWSTIEAADVDGDGDVDYLLGNLGLNTKYKADASHVFEVYGDDFDDSGSFDVVLVNQYKDKLVPVRGKQCSSEQLPFINQKFSTYESFANASVEEVYGKEALAEAIHYKANNLASIWLENLGDKGFKQHVLPNEVQISPITDFEIIDIDGDGTLEVVVVGNHFPVEVETIRFDASKGAVLGFENGEYEVINHSGFKISGDARRVKSVKQKDGNLLLILKNNSFPEAFRLN